MKDLLEILTRIEKQNQKILSRLDSKASRKYLSVEEAAERLDRSPWTIRQLCVTGRIEAVKGDNGCWRIPADEVAKLEENGMPKLPMKKLASSQPALLRGKGAGIAASSHQSRAPSTCL